MGDNVRDKYYCELAWLMGQSPLYAKDFNEQAKKTNEKLVQIEMDYANNPDNADFKMKKTPKMTIRPASVIAFTEFYEVPRSGRAQKGNI